MLRLGTRLSGGLAGYIAAIMFAIDPFLIRFDSRVFLDPSALFWVLLGYLCLFNSFDREGGSKFAFGLAAGIAMGLGVLSNEMAAPMVVVPLAVCLLSGFPYPRRAVVNSAGAFSVVIVTYLGSLAGFGQLTTFVSQQTGGVLRLVGASQQTGFNKPGAPSFISRVVVHLGNYGAVYAVLALAIVPTIFFLFKGTPPLRFVALIGVTAYAVISYQILLGTLEEQMFYYVDVPAILILALGIAYLLQIRPQQGRILALTICTLIAVTSLIAIDLTTWVQVHASPDTELVSAITWVDTNVGAGSKVAPLVDTSELLVNNYQVEMAESPSKIQDLRPAFIITSSLQVAQGYGFASPTLVRWLRAHTRAVYESNGRTFGKITVWKTGYPASVEEPPGPPGPTSPLPRFPVGEG